MRRPLDGAESSVARHDSASRGAGLDGYSAIDPAADARFVALSAILFTLVALAAGAGVLVEGVYRDNLLVRAGWFGNDLVTLIAALPLLAITTVWARRGSPRA